MSGVKVGDIQVLGQLGAMQCLIKLIMKGRVNNIKFWNRRFPPLEYNATIYIMQAVVTCDSLIRESTIIVKEVL
jgi:hypothetical protein